MSKFKAAKEAGKLFEYFFDRLLRGFRKDQGREPENLEMILIRQEAGNKAKEADKVVEVQFGKPFGEEVNKLIESGDVKIGEVTKKNDNVIKREMFQNSNLNKDKSIIGQINERMDNINNASKRLDEIMKERDEMYRPKTDEEIAAKFEKQNKEAAERLRKKMKDEPEDMATGGRAGHYTGGIVDVEPSLSDIGHGSDALMARTRLVSPGNQATTSTGLNYLLAEDNDNLRVPFAKGKIAKEVLDKGRRGFMKAAGAAGAGIAALKTGLLGFGEKAAPVVEKVAKTVSETAQSVPPYFFRLVEKIRFMGDETLASQDKAIAKKYKDYVMEEDFAGNITIVKSGEDLQGNKLEDVYMSYKVDDVALKDKDGFAKAEEYEEFTARPDMEGKMKDVEPGVPDEVIEEAGDIDAMTLKKAEGGRIGFNKGKLVVEGGRRLVEEGRRFLEKVFGKEKLKNIVENDPELEQGMLEVVEMFRNKDKAALIDYMQNFLPQMSKKELEAFIISSGDSAGIEGQLIRLGSGRDYRNKLDMIEEANNMRKLENFDVEGVSKNAEGGRINFDGGGSPLQRLRQEIVDSMKGYAPGDVTEDQLQLVVKDITLDMTPEQAQASALSNFRKLFGMAQGGLATMLGE